MAIGFTPKHIDNLPFNELLPEQFLVVALDAAKQMDWQVGYISDTGFIAYTNNGAFSWNAEVKIKIEDGHAELQSASTGNEMIDWGKNKKNINKFIAVFEEVKSTSKNEDLQLKYEELRSSLIAPEDDILQLPPPTKAEQIKGFLSIFKPVKGFFITPIIIDLNISIFVLMVITGVSIMEPDNESLIRWGANFRPITLEGQWWRLLTNCFLHIGILHLLMNMYALLNIAVLLEPILGRTRYLAAYLLTGIVASMTSLWWHDLTVSAGASGAIFGMYGVFLAMLTTDIIEKTTRKTLLSSITVFVAFNLIYGLKGGIDNAAHIGGLISGLVVGYAFIPSLKRPAENKFKYSSIGLLSLLILVSSFAVYQKLPNDIAKYEAKMKEFAAMEEVALEVYHLPNDSPKEKFLNTISEKGIVNWKKSIKLIDDIEKLDLPDEIRKKDKDLKKYCQLRLQCYELLYKAIDEDTDQYKNQLADYNAQIEAIINELGTK
ncbi:rhomboid family intramembrane serine protease [Solitalea sp. MAHUQ-68]|uniref:Rhomboid family intramembrane serine protease n=1 Tax=Solitalea agri TaxID=2953739 RepID=A0A9X2F3U2_9SPHI|nr:rhomboid family intramembrane serine protease [Solitalea agri]MCO4293781.1 rhomboid family intramembrane serine protease [Solitalea agri]